MTPADRQDMQAQANEYDRLAAHYEQESIKLQRWRKKRVAQVEEQAERRGEATPYVNVDPASVAYSWCGTDPKLNEYAAGMAIVERRATMYAQMSASLKMTLLLEAFEIGITVTGSLINR
jgi:hypothetical protein